MRDRRLSRRALYQKLDEPGAEALKEAHKTLDEAVRDAYGMNAAISLLEHLFEVNLALAEAEARGAAIQGPGLPACVNERERVDFVTSDCVQAPRFDAPTEAESWHTS